MMWKGEIIEHDKYCGVKFTRTSVDGEQGFPGNVEISITYLLDENDNLYGSGFLFTNDDVYKKVAVLSPGEKARVCLCKLMIKRANLLLLDEPTNHLDPETQRIIGENFKNYEGTIIMVSHNPAFVSAVGVSRMLLLPSGKITNFESELLYKYHEVQNLK